jgi:GntR family transcriptional regulator
MAVMPLEVRSQSGATERDTGLTMDDLDFHSEYHVEDAPEDLPKAFGITPGTKLLHRIYRTLVRGGGTAFSLVDSYLVYDMIVANPDLLDSKNEPWPGATHDQLRTVGIERDKIIDEVTARPPLRDGAELMVIGQGIAALVLRKTSVDISGRVVQISNVIHPVSNVIHPGDRTVMVHEKNLEKWPES